MHSAYMRNDKWGFTLGVLCVFLVVKNATQKTLNPKCDTIEFTIGPRNGALTWQLYVAECFSTAYVVAIAEP